MRLATARLTSTEYEAVTGLKYACVREIAQDRLVH